MYMVFLEPTEAMVDSWYTTVPDIFVHSDDVTIVTGGGAQDFLTYVEEDVVGNRLAVTGNRIDITAMQMNEACKVYKDFGVGHFDALDIDATVYIAGATTTSSTNYFIGLFNSTSSWAAPGIACWAHCTPGGSQRIRLGIDSLLPGAYDEAIVSQNTVYYLTLTRDAGSSTATLIIYSDAARTVVVDTLTVTGLSTEQFRYLFVTGSLGTGSSGTKFTGYIQDVSINEEDASLAYWQLNSTTGQFTITGGTVNITSAVSGYLVSQENPNTLFIGTTTNPQSESGSPDAYYTDIYYDNTSPSGGSDILISTLAGGYYDSVSGYSSGRLFVEVTGVADGESGLKHVIFSMDMEPFYFGTVGTHETTLDTRNYLDGEYTLTATIQDIAGNVTSHSKTLILNNTAEQVER